MNSSKNVFSSLVRESPASLSVRVYEDATIDHMRRKIPTNDYAQCIDLERSEVKNK